MKMKKSVFNGKVSLYNGMVFGTLADGTELIIANCVADAKALKGCVIEYKDVVKGDKTYHNMVSVEL